MARGRVLISWCRRQFRCSTRALPLPLAGSFARHVLFKSTRLEGFDSAGAGVGAWSIGRFPRAVRSGAQELRICSAMVHEVEISARERQRADGISVSVGFAATRLSLWSRGRVGGGAVADPKRLTLSPSRPAWLKTRSFPSAATPPQGPVQRGNLGRAGGRAVT